MDKTIGISTIDEVLDWNWEQFEPYYTALIEVEISEATLPDWLKSWTAVSDVRDELYNRLYVATTVNTIDKNHRKGLTVIWSRSIHWQWRQSKS